MQEGAGSARGFVRLLAEKVAARQNELKEEIERVRGPMSSAPLKRSAGAGKARCIARTDPDHREVVFWVASRVGGFAL
jgi:hypothetical protein